MISAYCDALLRTAGVGHAASTAPRLAVEVAEYRVRGGEGEGEDSDEELAKLLEALAGEVLLEKSVGSDPAGCQGPCC